MTIQTVLGPKEPAALGKISPHEHLLISHGIPATFNKAVWIDDIEKSCAEVEEFKKYANTIIDAQPGGCNRMATGLAQISKRTGVNIISSTGFHKHIFYNPDHWLFTASEQTISDLFIDELSNGMYEGLENGLICKQTNHRAGIIKIANDVENLTYQYQKCYKAAVNAAVQCNVPLMVHIEQGSDPKALMVALKNWGAAANRILFCHLDREIMPISFYTQFLDAGISLEFDTIGRFKYHSDEDEAQLIKNLFDLGYEDQILCSLDTTRERLKSYNPQGIGLSYLYETFFPMLATYGVSEQQIKKISHDNVIRVFSTTKA